MDKMGNAISADIRNAVVKAWVERLLSTRQIAKEVGISNGKVSEILTEERKRQPDLEELRALRARLKEGPGYAESLLNG
jgi:predicted transcriptional regulator